MRLVNRFAARLRALLSRDSVIGDMDEEIRAHLDLMTQESLDRGMSHADANRAALMSFGNIRSAKERAYEIKGGGMIETLIQDIRYGCRMLIKQPGLTVITVFILALGIGATTAIFSVVNAVLLRPLPIKDPGRVVNLHNKLLKIGLAQADISALQYLDYKEATAFEAAAALGTFNVNLTGLDSPQRLQAGRVTASFFPTLGIAPLAGRQFDESGDKAGGPNVTMLSYSLWQRIFKHDSAIIGKPVQLDGKSYEIIGVAPAGLEQLYPNIDIWTPMAFTPRDLLEERRWSLTFKMIGRLKSGVGLAQAQAEMTGVARRATGDKPNDADIEVRPFVEEQVGDVRRPLLILFAAVAAILLISCANVASLLLARASARTNEIAIRAAMGAGRSRIVRQLLTESLLIALAGGLIGIAIAKWGTSGLISLAPANLPRLNEVGLNTGVLSFTLLISLASGIVFGLFPAITASRTDLVHSLKESGRTETPGSTRHRLRGALVIAEVALAFVVIISAGLLLRSFGKLLDVKPGFNPHNVMSMRISLPPGQYPDGQRTVAFYQSVLQKMSGLPGVKATAVAFQPPFTSGGEDSTFAVRNEQAGGQTTQVHANYLLVAGDYFQTLGIPLVKGRYFTASDIQTRAPLANGSPVIVDEVFAKLHWPNSDPIGAGITWIDGIWATVVGVVGTTYSDDLANETKGAVYLPYCYSNATILVRTANDPHSLIVALRDQVTSVDRNQPVFEIQSMDERIAHSLDERRFAVTLLGLFAGIGLLLATIGLYGVIAYLVTQRTHEIGIRMALGAQAGHILTLIVGQGLKLAMVGLALGLVGAYFLTRLIGSQLYGITATDPMTFIAVSVVLLAAALLGCYLPARRGAKVDPMIALRNE